MIPLPPLNEQQRIATILDKAEALRRKRGRALALLNNLSQSLFSEMFGDVSESTSLGDAALEFKYGTSEKSTAAGRPVLRIPNIVQGHINIRDLKLVEIDQSEYQRLKLAVGDLLVVRTNGNPDYVGRCSVVDEDLYINSGRAVNEFVYASYLIRIRLDEEKFDPLYIQTHLSSKRGRRALIERARTSAGQFNINIESLSSIMLPQASLDMQHAFSRRMQYVKQSIKAYRKSEAQDDALFASLQHRAFTGQL